MNTRAPLDSTPSLWTAGEVAALLRCEPRTVRRKTRTEALPFVRIASNRMLFDPAAVRRWIEERAVVLAPDVPAAGQGTPAPRKPRRPEAAKLPGWDGVRRAGRRKAGQGRAKG